MMQADKSLILISASPKIGEKATSDFLVSLQEGQMQTEELSIRRVNVRQCLTKKTTETAFGSMLEADALVLTFPLYYFCLPGMLIRFLQDYYQYYLQRQDSAHMAKIYAVVNCGFPEASINEEAIRVVKSFSEKIGADFRFGVMIGGGGMLLGAADAPFMKKTFAALNGAFQSIARDIMSGEQTPLQNIAIQMNFPRKLYLFMGNKGWVSEARKNGLKKRDLYRKPYRTD